MEKVKAESGFPMPQAINPGRTSIYPWETMKVGQSFPYSGKNKNGAGQMVTAANKKFAPKRFASRRLEDGSFRVWRTA